MRSLRIKLWGTFLATLLVVYVLTQATATDVLAAVRAPEATFFTSVVRHCFDRWDRNHDGRITAAEIDANIPDHSLNRSEAAALATLKLYEVRAKNTIVFTRDLLRAYEFEVDSGAKPEDDYDLLFQACRKKVGMARQQLVYAVMTHINSAHKGNAASCSILALALSLRNFSDKQLNNMISDNGANIYRIAIPGKPAVKVTVPSKTEIACDPHSLSRVYWERRLEATCSDIRPAVAGCSASFESLLYAMAVFELVPKLSEHGTTEPHLSSAVNHLVGPKHASPDLGQKLAEALR